MLLRLSFTAAMMGGTAMADVPGLAFDIAPAHSLVARVMEGVGSRKLIVQPCASPHENCLRPSRAGALQDADLASWTGEDLMAWMADAVENVAGNTAVTTLPEAERTTEFARQCQGIPDGWTNFTDRPRPLFTNALSRVGRLESDVSA